MTSRALMPRLALLLCALVATTNAVDAQDKAVDRIKRSYEQIREKIELSERGVEESTYAGIFCNEVIANRNDQVWPAVGNYQMKYRFYYDNAGTEGHHYPDRLRMVVMTSRMSDRSYRAEYLFNEAGALIFYYAKPDEPAIGDEPRPLEQRIYFANGRPIRLIRGQTTDNRLGADDRAVVARVVATSKQIKLFFETTLSLPDN
jgi:hypothetical protein